MAPVKDWTPTIDLRGPRSCLVCLEPTTSEGQLCPACVARGHRVENDTLIVNIGPRL